MPRIFGGFGGMVVAGVFAAASAALPAIAQENGFYVELNNQSETDAGCDTTFFVSNRSGQAFDSVVLYVVIFDRDAVARADVEVPVGRLGAGKAGVQGAQLDYACSDISALFLNGVTCGADFCPADVVLASRTGTPFADDESVLRADPEIAISPPDVEDGPRFIDTPPAAETPEVAEIVPPVEDDMPDFVPGPDIETVSPPEAAGEPTESGTWLVSVSWPTADPADDIDTFVAAPDGSVVYYHRPGSAYVDLIRDDRGNYREEYVERDGQWVPDPANVENVSIRPGLAGEYIVNIYHYIANGTDPVPVEVTLERQGTTSEVVHRTTIDLDHRGHEETALRFTLDADGELIGEVTNLFEAVTDRVRADDGPAQVEEGSRAD